MFPFLARKFGELIFVMFAVSILVFASVHFIPGDPASVIVGPDASPDDLNRVRESLGLNNNLIVQYLDYVGNVVRGDLGYSFQTGQSVEGAILARFPNTLKLAIAALIVSLVIGLPLGVLAAIKRKTFWDTAASTISIAGISIPNFWLGAMLILGFAVTIPLFPVAGLQYPFWTREGLLELVLPAVTLGTSISAIIARMTRSQLLEVLNSDYIRTVRAKGMSEGRVIWVHALRNSLIPVMTVVGLNFGALLGGTIVVEQVFAINGIGQLIVNALNARDFPMIQGSVLLMAAIFVLVNFLVDVSYAIVDPRINVE